jgi:hypothetical protein
MVHPIHRVAHFEISAPYTLVVSFTDGAKQVIDLEPVLFGPLFGPLRDLSTFNAVRLDTEVGTLTWPNGADFDPSTLHDWPAVCHEFAARARAWERSTSRDAANGPMEPTRR